MEVTGSNPVAPTIFSKGLRGICPKSRSTNRSTQFIESSPKPCPIPSGTPLARPVFHRHRPQRPCHMSSEWEMHDNGAQDRAAESARELKKSRPLTERIHTSKCCTNCCTNPPPERPKTTRNAPKPPIFHNNIHKAESFRNRQVIGSSPIVGSIKFLRFMHLAAALAAITFVCVVNCVVTVPLRSHITL